jgi:hypothetical protein
MLNRRKCLALYIAFIDPFVQSLAGNAGHGLVSNLLALIFVLIRLVESVERIPFLHEKMNLFYMTLLGAYAAILAQTFYLQCVS